MDPGSGVAFTSYEGKQLLPKSAQPEFCDTNGSNADNYTGHRCISHTIKAPRTVVLFAAAALACIFLHHFTSSLQLSNSFSSSDEDQTTSTTELSLGRYRSFSSAFNGGQNQSFTHATDPIKHENAIDLGSILKNAAMKHKTVIITTLNNAWAEPNSVFDLFLKSFQIGYKTKGLLNHLVVVALDDQAYARCSKIHPHCYALSSNGIDFSEEAYFMTPDYLKMMWRRIEFLGTVLDLGYNFIFTDADVMWFRNPFPHFYADVDFQIACDNFRGNASDMSNSPNGGFNFVKSNKRSIEFYKFWYTSREKYPGLHDQDVLNKIKYDPFINQIGLRIRFLDTAYFGGFCQVSKDLNKVCTMHANCCVGMDNKIFDLDILLDDWRKYILAKTNDMRPLSSWTVPQRCGPPSFRSRPRRHSRSRKHKKKVKKEVAFSLNP